MDFGSFLLTYEDRESLGTIRECIVFTRLWNWTKGEKTTTWLGESATSPAWWIKWYLERWFYAGTARSDSMVAGRKFRTSNVIDDCSREILGIEIDTSLSSKRIIRVLEQIGLSRGFPKTIRSDNGPRRSQEFTSKNFAIWCADNNIETRFIQPGKPIQNGFIERFNRLYREAVLDDYLFLTWIKRPPLISS